MISAFVRDALVTSGIAVATNTDNFFVALAFGAKRTSIGIGANLIISSLSLVSTWVSVHVGWLVASWVFMSPALLSDLSFIVLGFVQTFRAVVLCHKGRRCTLEKGPGAESGLEEDSRSINGTDNSPAFDAITPEAAACTSREPMSLQMGLFLGLLLSVSNVFYGVAAGIAEFNVNLYASLSFCTSLISIYAGSRVGLQASRFFSTKLAAASPLFISAIGFYKLYTDLS